MNKNLGMLDRIMRTVIAGILLYLGLGVYAGSPIGTILAIASTIPLMTALLSSCPIYNFLEIRTRKAHPSLRSK